MEGNNNYVKRTFVLDLINEVNSFGGFKSYSDYSTMFDLVDDMPAADVKPVKHGRWVEQKHTPTNGYNYNVPYSTYICSSCGLEIHNDEYSKYVRGTYTNCPVCTARMDGDLE